jgi:predicted AAA+ superfamily ATPase
VERQAGKSTLVRIVAADRLAERRDLDRAQDRAAAHADPIGFVDSPELLVIDEIQRNPELLLAIKAAVDEDPRPGRYLLTGSSRLFGMVAAPDALPGRMETIELWPVPQRGHPSHRCPQTDLRRLGNRSQRDRDRCPGAAPAGFPVRPAARIVRPVRAVPQLTWSERPIDLSHYRDQARYEVDAVLETRSGQVVGIEIKAASTVGPDDFRDLRRLAERGDDLTGPSVRE